MATGVQPSQLLEAWKVRTLSARFLRIFVVLPGKRYGGEKVLYADGDEGIGANSKTD